ncbi:MAG: alpha/beta hydrolase [Chloroflexi bacterium]|nr:alpha/beta hydrolase [Chloroflexota bacterium]
MTDNPVLHAMEAFSEKHSRDLAVGPARWRYYALGQGPAVFWLTGGLRRAAFGYGFLECLARTHRVIAPDYPPLMTWPEMSDGFDAILAAEGVNRFALGGQSYGGLLAQGYLARRPEAVERLVLSSTGPAAYGPLWALVDDLAIALVRLLPEQRVKRLLAAGLGKVITTPEGGEEAWRQAMEHVLVNELSRADVVSHFAVAASLIRSRRIDRRVLAAWPGTVFVLTAENDPTQSPKDIPAYAALFGRQPLVLSLGTMGHTAALQDPEAYVELLERALG